MILSRWWQAAKCPGSHSLNACLLYTSISSNKDCQVQSKKAWLTERLDQGLVFLKGDVRGKCFIEYIPAEYAWAPIEADGYLYIDCLWVSGQFKGHGYSCLLYTSCKKPFAQACSSFSTSVKWASFSWAISLASIFPIQ